MCQSFCFRAPTVCYEAAWLRQQCQQELQPFKRKSLQSRAAENNVDLWGEGRGPFPLRGFLSLYPVLLFHSWFHNFLKKSCIIVWALNDNLLTHMKCRFIKQHTILSLFSTGKHIPPVLGHKHVLISTLYDSHTVKSWEWACLTFTLSHSERGLKGYIIQ